MKVGVPPPMVSLNGQAIGESWPLSRGLHYGDGVFRTMLKAHGGIVDIELQLAKLKADAEALQLACPTSLRAELDVAAASDPADAVLKVLLWRASGGRGYASTQRQAECLVIRYPLPAFDPRHRREGIAALRSPVTMAAQPLLAGLKHLNRLEQVLASRDWPEGIDEAILGDDLGQPVCGTRSNLFWVSGGVLHTPSLVRCGVAGVMRGKVLALADLLGLETRVASAAWAAFSAADEAFISNSLIGIWPLRALDAQRWPAPGPITLNLMRALAHPTLPA